MIGIKFGKWCHKAGKLFVYDRVYLYNGKATPLVVMRFRNVGIPPWDVDISKDSKCVWNVDGKCGNILILRAGHECNCKSTYECMNYEE